MPFIPAMSRISPFIPAMSRIPSSHSVLEPKAEDPVPGWGPPTLPAPLQGGPHVVILHGEHTWLPSECQGALGPGPGRPPQPPSGPLCFTNPPQLEEAGKQLLFMNRNSIRQRFLGAGRG